MFKLFVLLAVLAVAYATPGYLGAGIAAPAAVAYAAPAVAAPVAYAAPAVAAPVAYAAPAIAAAPLAYGGIVKSHGIIG
ncbi:cuticle protein 16.5 [Anabrus simplex]|uniref:cuticle protein 16.5 n=1 Tax=Anabrus simplex TaxID=316456 RepID=UPI0035A297C8